MTQIDKLLLFPGGKSCESQGLPRGFVSVRIGRQVKRDPWDAVPIPDRVLTRVFSGLVGVWGVVWVSRLSVCLLFCCLQLMPFVQSSTIVFHKDSVSNIMFACYNATWCYMKLSPSNYPHASSCAPSKPLRWPTCRWTLCFHVLSSPTFFADSTKT